MLPRWEIAGSEVWHRKRRIRLRLANQWWLRVPVAEGRLSGDVAKVLGQSQHGLEALRAELRGLYFDQQDMLRR